MSAHNHDHSPNEKKPVSFTTPFILACVTLVFVFGFLSLCNPKHGCCDDKECSEKCEKTGGCDKECEDKQEHNDEVKNNANDKATEAAPANEGKGEEVPAEGKAPAEH